MIKDATIKVEIDESLGLERALKKFKRMCEAFGVVKEYRDRKEYKKPSVKHKEKTEAARKRVHKINLPSFKTSKI